MSMGRLGIFMPALVAVVLSGCSGTFHGFTPDAAQTSSEVTLSLSSLSFASVGASAAQTVTATQSNYSGSFAASTPAAGQPNSCNGIATISPSSGTSFSVMPVAAGQCVFTIAANGEAANLTVTVTTTTIGGS